MFTREYLLRPPSNLEMIETNEGRLKESADRFIEEIIIRRGLIGFDVGSINFNCSYNDVFAQARITESGCYSVEFGRKFTVAIFNASEYVAPYVSKVMPWIDNEDSISFVFDYVAWFIFLHEIAHVLHGHIDYIRDKGIKGYVEINNERAPLLHLHRDIEKSKQYWRAFESEADAYAVSASLPTYNYINQMDRWLGITSDEALFCHGVMISISFYILGALAKGRDDFRHPDAKTRLHLSLPSINALAKNMNLNVKKCTKIMVDAYVETARKVFGDVIDINEALASAAYMFSLDKVIEETGISNFRKTRRSI